VDGEAGVIAGRADGCITQAAEKISQAGLKNQEQKETTFRVVSQI
jgi:hypothetical protein